MWPFHSPLPSPSPPRTSGKVWGQFRLSQGEGECSRHLMKAGILLNILWSTGHPPTAKNYLAENVSYVKLRSHSLFPEIKMHHIDIYCLLFVQTFWVKMQESYGYYPWTPYSVPSKMKPSDWFKDSLHLHKISLPFCLPGRVRYIRYIWQKEKGFL